MAPRLEKDQRHAQRRLVGEQPVRHLAVLAERLAVVRGEDDERVGVVRAVERRLKEWRERGVGGGDLAEVGRGAISRGERLRRRVREVRLVEVHPREPGRCRARLAGACGAALAHPLECGGDGRRRRALGHAEGDVGFALGEAVVVDVEAARQAEAGVEREGADEGAGAIAARVEQRRERVGGGRETEAGVFADAVAERIDAREDVGVRRQRHDRRGVGLIEADAGGGEAVDPGGGDRAVAVGADRVGAQRVDGDEEDVARRGPRGRGGAAAGGREDSGGSSERARREESQAGVRRHCVYLHMLVGGARWWSRRLPSAPSRSQSPATIPPMSRTGETP